MSDDSPRRAARPSSRRAPIFYGWIVVAAVFAILTACSGVTVYNLSVYLHAFLESGRFSISDVSLASATFSVAGGVVGLWAGKLLERHDIRGVMTSGALMMAAALAMLPWVDGLWSLYGFHLLLGAGYATCALIPCTTIVARWFSAQRSTAMSIAATGNSLGAIVVTPPSAMLVADVGLGRAGPWLGIALLALVLPMIWGLLRSWPRDKGLRALGEDEASDDAPAAPPSMPYREALRTRFYWASTLAFLFGMAAQVGGMTHVYNLVIERTADARLAGLAIAVMAAASVGARVIAVASLKRMSARAFIMALLVTQGLALAAAGVAPSAVLLVAAIALFGSTIGNMVTLQSILLTEVFGIQAYARLYALSRFFAVFGVVLGPGVIGMLHERTGDYGWPLLAVGAISVVGIAALAASGPPPGRSRMA
ncbi:MAG: MFS transporter [Burkholderiaceae bacterium]